MQLCIAAYVIMTDIQHVIYAGENYEMCCQLKAIIHKELLS